MSGSRSNKLTRKELEQKYADLMYEEHTDGGWIEDEEWFRNLFIQGSIGARSVATKDLLDEVNFFAKRHEPGEPPYEMQEAPAAAPLAAPKTKPQVAPKQDSTTPGPWPLPQSPFGKTKLTKKKGDDDGNTGLNEGLRYNKKTGKME